MLICFFSWPHLYALSITSNHAGRVLFVFNLFIFLIFLNFFQLATIVGKSDLEIPGAMTAQDKITSAAMAAPAKMYRNE
jgi:hypothetical protein